MSTRSLLKVAALVGGIGWAIYLAIQWNDYFTAMSAIEKNPFAKFGSLLAGDPLTAIRNRLIGQSIGAIVLIVIGFAINGNESSEATAQVKKSTFEGTPDISNDAYKIFLVEKYAINKNDVLGGYTLNGHIYKSIDEALAAAHAIYCPTVNSEPAPAIKKSIDPEHEAPNIIKKNEPTNLVSGNTRIVGTIFIALLAVGGSFFYFQHNGGLTDKQISEALQGTWGVSNCDEAKILTTYSFSSLNQLDQLGTRTETSAIAYKEEKSHIQSTGGLKFIKKISSWDGGNRSGSDGQFEYEFTDGSLNKFVLIRTELIDSKGNKSVMETRNGKRYIKSWDQSEFKEQDGELLPFVKCPSNKDYLQSKKHAIETGWYIELAGFGDSDEAKNRVIELNKEFETLKVVWTYPVKTQRGTYSIVVDKAFQSESDAGTQRTKFEELFGKKGIRLDSSLISSSEINSRI